MLKKSWIPVILCVIVILAGCDEGQRMTNTVITQSPAIKNTEEDPPDPPDPMVEEQASDILDIDFSDVVVREPTRIVPEGILLLDTDQIEYFDSETFKQTIESYKGQVIFQTAAEAAASETMLNRLKEIKDWMKEFCGKEHRPYLSVSPLIGFPTREERQKFYDMLPGTYTVVNIQMADDVSWWLISEFVAIVDNKDAYFMMFPDHNNPCENFR